MWTVTLDGKQYDFDDLAPAQFQPIADRHMLSWLELYNTPAANIDAFYDILVVVAGLLDVDPPERPSTMGAVMRLLDLIGRTDGANVDPREGEPDDTNETNSSSTGSPDDTDGPQP